LLGQRGLDVSHVQRDATLSTGEARADEVGASGQMSFVISENAAWDQLEITKDLAELAGRADAVCFGTLAQRAPIARATVRRFLAALRPDALKVFDANLRAPFYSAEIVAASLESADVCKLNEAELPLVAEMLGLGGRGDHAQAHRLVQVFDLALVCVTRGSRGCLLVTPDDIAEHGGYRVVVRDAVGAGDFFNAAAAHHFLRGAPLEEVAARANLLGAWAATQEGAMPPAPEEGGIEAALAEIAKSRPEG
ncbi:MAG: PfkB family carbohydrate kinase, partial [Pyrinomonadaceae bacterium]